MAAKIQGKAVEIYSAHKTLILASLGALAVGIGGIYLINQFAPSMKSKVKDAVGKGKDAVVSKLAKGPVVSPTPLTSSQAQKWNPVGSIWEEEEETFQKMAKLESQQ